jgi:hypothetical protein
VAGGGPLGLLGSSATTMWKLIKREMINGEITMMMSGSSVLQSELIEVLI